MLHNVSVAPIAKCCCDSQRPNDYQREWMSSQRDIYLRELYEMEAGADHAICRCGKAALWRCLGCIGSLPICAHCLRDAHRLLPFHRVEFWSGKCWRAAWLRTVDMQVHLGHGGAPCSFLRDVTRNPAESNRTSDTAATSSSTRTNLQTFADPKRPIIPLPTRLPLPRVTPPIMPQLRRTQSAPQLSQQLRDSVGVRAVNRTQEL